MVLPPFIIEEIRKQEEEKRRRERERPSIQLPIPGEDPYDVPPSEKKPNDENGESEDARYWG